MRATLLSILCIFFLTACDPATREQMKANADARQAERDMRQDDRRLTRHDRGLCKDITNGAAERAWGGTARLDAYNVFCAGYVPPPPKQ